MCALIQYGDIDLLQGGRVVSGIKRTLSLKDRAFWFWVNLKRYPGYLFVCPIIFLLDIYAVHRILLISDGSCSLRPASDVLKDRWEEINDY